MFLKDTPWNQHGGVGATLLHNWVEERAVGADRIIKERAVPYISERGHADILTQDAHEDPKTKFVTVSRIAYKPSDPASAKRRGSPGAPGKLKTLKERAWTLEAVDQLQPKTVAHPPTFESTTAASYFSSDFEPALSPTRRPPAAAQAPTGILEVPITFWSHGAARGGHTVYASTPHGLHPESHVRTCIVGHSAVPGSVVDAKPALVHVAGRTASFGRHVDFSTPIAENVKTSDKP
ncbi:hypothetical protein GGF32_008793 [Allomyces javanicus]|nr:hypothetical protein GGF32_008793 [Allomyces javanicus]